MKTGQVYQGLGHVIIDNIQVVQSRADFIERLERQRGDSISRLKNGLKLGEDNIGSREALVESWMSLVIPY